MLLYIGCGLAALGLVANRWNTTMLAFTQPLTEDVPMTDPLVTVYTPAWTEWAATCGVVAFLLLAFSIGMRYFPAFKGVSVPEEAAQKANIIYPEYEEMPAEAD